MHVTTDVLVLDIDLKGGTLVRAELPSYPMVKGESQPVVLLNRDSPATNYVLQTGLAGAETGRRAPDAPRRLSRARRTSYTLAPGQQELRVPLTWTDGAGVTVTKTFIFKRGAFAIGLEYQVDNARHAPWAAHSYARIVRSDPAVERSMFKVESFAFRGPAFGVRRNQATRRITYHKIPRRRRRRQEAAHRREGRLDRRPAAPFRQRDRAGPGEEVRLLAAA